MPHFPPIKMACELIMSILRPIIFNVYVHLTESRWWIILWFASDENSFLYNRSMTVFIVFQRWRIGDGRGTRGHRLRGSLGRLDRPRWLQREDREDPGVRSRWQRSADATSYLKWWHNGIMFRLVCMESTVKIKSGRLAQSQVKISAFLD